MATAVHVTLWHGAGTHAPSVVLIHGSMTWGTACFERQRSLAECAALGGVSQKAELHPDWRRREFLAGARALPSHCPRSLAGRPEAMLSAKNRARWWTTRAE